MAATIRVRRGYSKNLPSLTLADGEPAFVKDTGKLLIGDGGGKVVVNPDIAPSEITDTLIGFRTVNQDIADPPSNTALLASLFSQMARELKTITGETYWYDPPKTSIATLLTTKANLNSPAFTGIPTAPTAATGTNTAQLATTEFVATAISDLVGGSPKALDTLRELGDALGNDPNFAATMTAAIAAKAPLLSPSLAGVPTAPTPNTDNESAQIATTAFVRSVLDTFVERYIADYVSDVYGSNEGIGVVDGGSFEAFSGDGDINGGTF